MSYGVKYQCDFDPVLPAGSTGYSLQLLQKGYGGSVTMVTGSTTPVTLDYQTDDPKAPIKGSSLAINLINDGTLPLTTFFSTDDDEWQVQLFYGANLKWIGYLVQDDCTETLVDFIHEINLSANDNLGLLKNVALDKSIITYDTILNVSDTFSTTAPNTLVVSSTVAASVQNNDLITITTMIYSLVLTVIDNSGGTTLIVAETVPNISSTTGNILLQRPSQFPDLITIAQLFNYCLAATDLQINTNIYGGLFEISQVNTSSFTDQTLINSQTFLKSGSNFYDYQDCYTILQNTLSSFEMCLLQANGNWQIMRWDELRYFGNTLTGFTYDSSFTLLGTTTLGNVFNAGPNQLIKGLLGLNHKIFRPWSFDKETFNYKQPAQLLRNFDLQTLGNLIRTYTTGSGITLLTFNEYACPWWYTDTLLAGSTVAVYFIRVIIDHLFNEVDRYLVLDNPTGEPIDSYKIDANKGDVFTLSINEQSSASNVAGSSDLYIYITDGVTPMYLVNGLGWTSSPNLYAIPPLVSPDNTNQWHSYFIDTTLYPTPYDGLLYFILYPIQNSVGAIVSGETRIKDIRLEYLFLVNESTKITGQTHTQYQGGNIKLNENVEIFLDDSPRNNIAGTLFLNSTTGLLQTRAAQWQLSYLYPTVPAANLGEVVTFGKLFWRRISRSILEGSFYGFFNGDGDHVSMLSVFKYEQFSTLNLVFGKLQIDFKNQRFTGTLWEIWADGESDSDLVSNYVFNYIYALK